MINKKLVTLAVGAALGVAPMFAAQADVKVYGRAQVELANTKISGTGDPAIDGTYRSLVDNAMGRVGIKASEDLGNGLTGLAKFEFKTDTVDNTTGGNKSKASLTGRASYVGIKGGFGTVTFGRNSMPYKDTNLDPYIATTLEARNGGGQSSGAFGHASFVNDTAKYVSPNLNGLKLSAALTLANKTVGGNGDYSMAADYKNGPLRLIAAYSNNKDASGVDLVTGTGTIIKTDKRTKVAGQYRFGNHTFTGQYEQVKNYNFKPGGAASDALEAVFGSGALYVGDANFLMLTYQLKMGNNTLFAKWAQEKYKDMNNEKNKVYEVAMTHKMSKTFRLFGGYQQSKFDAGEKATNFSVGMRKDF